MPRQAILLFICILACVESSRFLKQRDSDDDSYLKVYSCSSAQNNHMHVFTYKFPRDPRRKARVLNARPTQRKPSEPDEIGNRMLFIGGDRVSTNQHYKITEFSYEACPGTQNDPGKIKTVKLLEDPIVPGDIKFAFTAELNVDIASPIKVEVEAYKEMIGAWIKMPCYNELGSCTYQDICQYTRYKPPCPADFQRDGIPCTCPVSKGTYKSDNLTVYAGMTDPMNIPSWLTDGRYKGEINYTAGGKRIACYRCNIRVQKV